MLTEDYQKKFGARLRQAAAKANVERACELGKIAGIHPTTVQAYWRGHRRPSYEVCLVIAEKLGCDGNWLHKGDAKPSSVDSVVDAAMVAKMPALNTAAKHRLIAAFREVANALEALSV
jgi:transcriptional regulator with XRE-family HTH domain